MNFPDKNLVTAVENKQERTNIYFSKHRTQRFLIPGSFWDPTKQKWSKIAQTAPPFGLSLLAFFFLGKEDIWNNKAFFKFVSLHQSHNI